METKKLKEIIDTRMKDMGILEYKIDGMKLNEGNYMINDDGLLERDIILDVYVRPIEAIQKITINIVINKTGLEWKD